MNRQIALCYLFALTLMEVVRTQVTEQGNSHGVLQETLLEGVSVSYQEFPGGHSGNAETSGDSGALAFSPPTLSFGSRPLGAPHSERVTLTNRANRTVHLTSISGNTMHFHSSFFEDKVIPPNGNTTFNVVFLGRERGHVDTSLFIHTSEGVHKYMMSGTSVPSAYRLQPLVGVRLPQNASFSPLIYMHNPHDHPIQITEVYSSGGGVVLELPGGATEGPQALWRVPPHTTRPVIAVRYRGPARPPPVKAERPHPHIAYVRIKVNGTQSVLVVAVEVFPSLEPGPYTVPHIVDFGMGGTRDPPKQMLVYMGNSSPRAVRVSSVTVRGGGGATHLGGGVRATPTSRLTLPPLSPPDVHVATLTIDWREAYESGQCCGKVIIRTKQGQHKIVLAYTSHVLSGGLTFDESITRYLTCEPGINVLRQFIVKNEYKMGIYITDIVLGEGIDKHFEIKDFWPKALEPNEAGIGFKIRLKNWSDSLKFESKITLNTNISALEIPVYIYNGKLDVSMSIPPPPSSKQSALDLGLVGVSSTSRATLALLNNNPAPVCLRGCGAELPGAALQLLGCSPPSPPAANITACTCIPPGWSAMYGVSVVAPARETSLQGELWVLTAHERVAVPLMLASANGGRLTQIDPTTFEDCFPGTLCTRILRVKSSFPVDMSVVSVEASPEEPRLFFEPPPNGIASTVSARCVSELGWLHYDPYLRCDGACYTGLDLNSTVGQQWLSRITLPADTLTTDTNLVNSRYSLYLNLTAKTPYNNLTIKLDTNQVRNHMMVTRVSLIWPRLQLAGGSLLEAPLAQLAHTSRLQLALANPSSSRPVLVQLLLAWMLGAPEPRTQLPLELEPLDCLPHRPCQPVADRTFYFPRGAASPCQNFGLACRSGGEQAACPAPGRDCPVSWLPSHLNAHPESCIFTLPPGGERNVTIEFLANYSARVSSLLYIRNNLTIIEVLRLSGQGAVPSLKFGNRKPGSSTPLLFDLTEKHLKDCERGRKPIPVQPNLTVKRTFVARNTGQLPIRVTDFYINSVRCEGYGFKVLNCDPFELLPNATYKVDIAFTPDFTLTKVERMLILETSLNTAVNYTLVSSIPVSLAGRCAAVLRRPPWEPSLRSAALSLLMCIGICILIAGFYDSDQILKMASVALTRDRGVVHPPLDLRAIGQMGMNKKPETWECCPSPLEKKKETSNFKVSSWNLEDRAFLMDDMKLSCQGQKYEEITQSVTKSRKKLAKRNSNTCDVPPVELITGQEVTLPKEKKAPTLKEHNSHPSWKSVFARNNILKSVKQMSPEQSDTVKLISNNPQEDKSTEKSKLVHVPKKLASIFNGDAVSESPQTHHIPTSKKLAKAKCHTHQSHSEEDTSSTTTESSNNDEGDKDNDNSTSSSNKSTSSGSSKKVALQNGNKKGKCTAQYKDSYEGDGEDEEYDHKSQGSQNSSQNDPNQRWTKHRENSHGTLAKANAEIEKQKFIETKNTNATHECTPIVQKANKKEYKANAKKEKLALSKKRSLDKSFVFGVKTDSASSIVNGSGLSTSSFNAARSSPSTPPAVPTVWENKASFSDVVARSDNNSLYSTNYVPKEPETRKPESKTVPNVISAGIATASNSTSLYSNPKTDAQSKNVSSDLGPIGSNYYPKKSPTSWMETLPENKVRHYGTPAPAVPQPIKKPQPQKINEDIGLMNNNSFFLNSNSYFSGSISDLAAVRSQMALANQVGNTPPNNYSSVGASMNGVGNASNKNMSSNAMNVQSMGSPPGIIQHPENLGHSSNTLGSLRDLNAIDTSKYTQMAGSLLELVPNAGQLDSNSGRRSGMSDSMQLTGMEAFDNPIPWDRSTQNSGIALIGSSNPNNESIFDMDYGSRNLYADNKTPGWGGSSSLWEQASLGGRAGLASPGSLTQDSPLLGGGSSSQSSNIGNMIPTDRGPAEWLWGYGGGGGLGAIGSVPVRPPPGLAPLQPRQQTHYLDHTRPQQPQTQQQQPQTVRAFDPFHSLSSIWTPGSSLDRWSNNQHNRDSSPGQDHSAHGQYQ